MPDLGFTSGVMLFALVGCGAPAPRTGVETAPLVSAATQVSSTASLELKSAGAAEPSKPLLEIPGDIFAEPGYMVTVPVLFTAGEEPISTIVFSIDYDPATLELDPADRDEDGIPDAVRSRVPVSYTFSAMLDPEDADGELDVVIADMLPPLGGLPGGVLVEISFTTAPSAGSTVADVDFSQEPPPSFGSSDGRSVSGVASGGSVRIGAAHARPPSVLVSPTSSPSSKPRVASAPSGLSPTITPDRDSSPSLGTPDRNELRTQPGVVAGLATPATPATKADSGRDAATSAAQEPESSGTLSPERAPSDKPVNIAAGALADEDVASSELSPSPSAAAEGQSGWTSRGMLLAAMALLAVALAAGAALVAAVRSRRDAN